MSGDINFTGDLYQNGSLVNFGSGGNTDAKAWKDIWGSGQGIGGIKDDPSVGDLVERIIEEYNQAKKEFNDK